MRLRGYLTEAVKAADWEEVIVLAWNHLNLGLPYNSKKLLQVSNIKSIKPWVREALPIGESICGDLGGREIKSKKAMKHTGSASGQLSDFWKAAMKESGDRGSGTPKTDFYMPGHRISLKKEGPSQLMSGKRGETYATFAAALDMARNEDALGTALLDRIQYGFVKDRQRDAEDDVDFKEIHAELIEDIEDFLDQNPIIKKYVVLEAMTGQYKFHNSWATADHIMVFSPKGTCKKYKRCTNDYAGSVANQVKMRVSIKAQSGKGPQSSSFRVDIKEGTIWEDFEKEKHLLNELKVVDWLKNFSEKVIKKVKKLINKGIKAVMDYLGLELDVKISNVVTF